MSHLKNLIFKSVVCFLYHLHILHARSVKTCALESVNEFQMKTTKFFFSILCGLKNEIFFSWPQKKKKTVLGGFVRKIVCFMKIRYPINTSLTACR